VRTDLTFGPEFRDACVTFIVHRM